MANARKLAVKALVKVEQDGAYSNITLNKIFAESDTSNEDRALTSALFYGTLDRKITVDYILSKFIKKPLNRITPITLATLRISVYQLRFMEKIPESAAVNEAVKIIKSSKEKFNVSFVNAVLRNIIRNNVQLPQDNSVGSLSVRYSCPAWIIESFINDYGIETAIELLKASVSAPPVILRCNTCKISPQKLVEELQNENITAKCVEPFGAVEIIGGIDIKNSLCYKNGLFHIQDGASQLSVLKLNPKPFERILDMCSAPGGKSFTMAGLMENKGEILSFDLYDSRVNLIKKGAERLGFDIIKANVGDATSFNEKIGQFDAVLCDVPCSGFGVLRRKPEIKYKTEENFIELKEIQEKILDNASRYLKENGRLLYSTCTLRFAENQGMVKTFLDKNPDYGLQYEHTYMPHIDGTDGFYCALMIKKG